MSRDFCAALSSLVLYSENSSHQVPPGFQPYRLNWKSSWAPFGFSVPVLWARISSQGNKEVRASIDLFICFSSQELLFSIVWFCCFESSYIFCLFVCLNVSGEITMHVIPFIQKSLRSVFGSLILLAEKRFRSYRFCPLGGNRTEILFRK